MLRRNTARMEFHVSRQARDHYQFEEWLFSYSGSVIFGFILNALAARSPIDSSVF